MFFQLDEINENRANLAYMITTDDVARMCENIHDDRERLCVTIKHELVKTLGFHRYSSKYITKRDKIFHI